MSVVLSFEEVGPWKKKLEIEVPSAAVDAELQRVTRDYARQAQLPGFRKGKVPASVVRKRFGEEIDREVVERLVPRYWTEARAEKNLDTLIGPTIEQVRLEPGKPMVFTATVEVRPEFELSENRDFDLPEPETAATEGEIDEVLERFRYDLGSWKTADRPAGRGDRVQLRIANIGEEKTADEEEGAEEPDWQEVAFEVGDDRYWDELTTAVTGLAAGQQGEFTRTVEHDHGHGEEEAEQGPHRHEQRFRFEITEVQERELPELDDAFAKRLGDHESLEVLRERVGERIGIDKTMAARQQRERAVLDQLRERHPLELPQGAVDTEVEGMLRDWATDLMRQGVDLEQAGIDWDEMRQRMRPDAEARLHARLLLDALVEADDVTVDDAELEATLARIGRAEGKSGAALRQQLLQEGRLEAFRNQIKRERALRSLLGEESVGVPEGETGNAEDDGEAGGESDEPRNESESADEPSDRGE